MKRGRAVYAHSNHAAAKAWMFACICILWQYLSTFLPASWAVLMICGSGIFTAPMMVEMEAKHGIALYVGVSLFGIALQGFSIMAPYVLFCGWYPLIRFFLDEAPDQVMAWTLRLFLFNLCMALCVYWAPVPLFQPYVVYIPFWGVALILNAAFVFYHVAVGLFAHFYSAVLRPIL